MREIKFRIWDGESEKMSSPFKIEKLKFGYLEEIDNSIIDENAVLMQYTGLKDKKRTKEYPEGQEIYEGDIVKHYIDIESHIGQIKYQESDCLTCSHFVVFISNENISEHAHANALEIIGNIYENPELLDSK